MAKKSIRLCVIFSSLLSAFVQTGCSEDDLPKYVNLGGLRILALSTEKTPVPTGVSEVSPGDTVRITPWISDYQGGTRTLSYSWQACPDPGVGAGAEPSCMGVTDATTVTSGSATVPGTERTGSSTSFDVSIPSTLLDRRLPVDQYNGVGYLVVYTLTASDGASVTGFTRVTVSQSSKTSKNQNPVLQDIVASGSSLVTFPTTETEIAASYAASSLESYTYMKSDGALVSATEDLVTTWFITDGEMKMYRSVNDATAKYAPPAARPTDHTPLVVGVMRDGRGGVSVLIRAL